MLNFVSELLFTPFGVLFAYLEATRSFQKPGKSCMLVMSSAYTAGKDITRSLSEVFFSPSEVYWKNTVYFFIGPIPKLNKFKLQLSSALQNLSPNGSVWVANMLLNCMRRLIPFSSIIDKAFIPGANNLDIFDLTFSTGQHFHNWLWYRPLWSKPLSKALQSSSQKIASYSLSVEFNPDKKPSGRHPEVLEIKSISSFLLRKMHFAVLLKRRRSYMIWQAYCTRTEPVAL